MKERPNQYDRDYRDRRPDNVKTGYLLDPFNPVIIETISFLSVCFV